MICNVDDVAEVLSDSYAFSLHRHLISSDTSAIGDYFAIGKVKSGFKFLTFIFVLDLAAFQINRPQLQANFFLQPSILLFVVQY